jgi:hypothetical protein
MSMPWSMTSAKKLSSQLKMSRSLAAARRASAYWPEAQAGLHSPPTQPVVAM